MMSTKKETAGKPAKKTAGKKPAPAPRESQLPEDKLGAEDPARTKDGPNEVRPFSDAEAEALGTKAISAAAKSRLQDEADRSGATPTDRLTLVTVMIVRDNSRTPVKVFPHEVDLLEAIHGADNVAEVPNAAEDVDVADFDPDSELDRLQRKYGKNAADHIQALFGGDGRVIADINGLSYRRNRTRNRTGEGAMMKDHSTGADNSLEARGKVARIVQKDAAPAKTASR